MTKVKRFFKYPCTFMEEGKIHSSIPYDWETTDIKIMEQYDKWKAENKEIKKILSITGPLRQMRGNVVLELIVIYEK